MMLAKLLTCLFALSISAPMLHAQASPTATRNGQIQVGVTASQFTLDYGEGYEKGFSVYGDIDVRRYFGAEFIFHDANIITPHDVGENSFMLGPRFHYRYRRFDPYAKVLFGHGTIKFAQGYYQQSSSQGYWIYSFGGGLDIKATRHINIRAIDLEYQEWPGYPPHGLTPYGYSIGAAYSF